ncbi:MAG: mannose-1-phosphate guanylyltransferase [Ornithinimicrobium sp.]
MGNRERGESDPPSDGASPQTAHPLGSLPGFYAVVPAGGAGTRLWPLSRRANPKFLHDLTGSGRSLLQQTADRLHPLCGDRLMVVTGRVHAGAVADSLPTLLARNLLIEPAPRDSLPAIGLAAAVAHRRDPDAVIGSFAADHVIDDHAAFTRCVTAAVQVAGDDDMLVTLGVQPSYPATGFGYLRRGSVYAGSSAGTVPAYRVQSFVEKPDRAVAERYVRDGHLWNAGMFVARAGVLLDMIQRWEPELAAGLRAVAADPESIEDIWATLPALTIDRAIAEPAAAAGRVVVLPADFDWDDIGDFGALARHLGDSARHPGLRVLGDEDQVVSVDSSGMVAAAGGRMVVVVGVPDVVVVDTADAILVTTTERVQDVKAIVTALHQGQRKDLT